jgi:hypothetical protein
VHFYSTNENNYLFWSNQNILKGTVYMPNMAEIMHKMAFFFARFSAK